MNPDYASLRWGLWKWERRFHEPSNVNIKALAHEKFQFAMEYGYEELQRVYNEVVMDIYEESKDVMPEVQRANRTIRHDVRILRKHLTRKNRTCYRRR